MPGLNEISTLVKELEEQHYVASWEARNMQIPPHAFKKSVARVGISDHQTAPSPLKQEVRPEEVVDSRKEHVKDWTEMNEDDYDGDYVASTDPIHPVNTDYSHPLDDDDGSWILNHFSPEEMVSPVGDLDFDQNSWSWDDNDNDSNKGINSMLAASQEENTTSQIGDNDLLAWGPEATIPSISTDISMRCSDIKERLGREQKELIIETFWSVVNECVQIKEQAAEDISGILHSLDITSTGLKHSLTTSTSHSFPSAPILSPQSWMDGSSDIPSSTSSPTSPCTFTFSSRPTRPPTLPSPNSTRSVYDKQRTFLKKRLQDSANQDKYYSDLLLVSRWEARAVEGPEGRYIADPQTVRACGGGTSNSWFQ
jgi:hypothetical protein